MEFLLLGFHLRCTIALNSTWLVNSAAHMCGKQPMTSIPALGRTHWSLWGPLESGVLRANGGMADVIDFVGGKA